MIGLAMMLMVGGSYEAADWKCADPLIAKNYGQRVEARQLALRIADECEIAPRNPLEQSLYATTSSIFILQIEMKIQQRRRAAAIKLKR